MARELTIGELSARSGVAPSALRFYERQKLISSRRTDGNRSDRPVLVVDSHIDGRSRVEIERVRAAVLPLTSEGFGASPVPEAVTIGTTEIRDSIEWLDAELGFLTAPFPAARYHSLVVSEDGWPDVLEIAARTKDDRTVMALRHREWPMHGVQFHPESILTSEGRRLLRNFLEM